LSAKKAAARSEASAAVGLFGTVMLIYKIVSGEARLRKNAIKHRPTSMKDMDMDNIHSKRQSVLVCAFRRLILWLITFWIALPGNSLASTQVVLHSFSGPDGWTSGALGGLVRGADGNLYGFAEAGGLQSNFCNATDITVGCGTLFKITPTGTFTKLTALTGDIDAGFPTSMILGADGNFYGVSIKGGLHSDGAVFRISPSGSYKTLYSEITFGESQPPIGITTDAGLVQGSDGSLYATFASQSRGQTLLYKMDIAGNLVYLTSIPGFALTRGPDGNLYGVSRGGGTHNIGAVFGVVPSTGAATVIYSFTGGADGGVPDYGLTLATDGNFYGTTSAQNFVGASSPNSGTVFKVTPSGVLTTLHTFPPSTATDIEPVNPSSPLVQGSDGNLFGVSFAGGSDPSAAGSLYSVTPGGKLTVLYSFDALAGDATSPEGPIVLSNDLSAVYGVSDGGANGMGAIYKIALSSNLSLLNAGQNAESATGVSPFSLSVVNSGPATATGVTVTTTLAAGVTFLAASSSPGCALSGRVVTCTVGVLNNGASAGVSIALQSGTPQQPTQATFSVQANQSNSNPASGVVTIVDSPAGSDIPTLPEWALLILAALLLIRVTWAPRRRSAEFSGSAD
jgi:uncharacterized repeat protein (TIGR01451 family)